MYTSWMASRNTDIQELKDQWSAALQSYRRLQLDLKVMQENMLGNEWRVDALGKAITAIEHRLGLRVDQTSNRCQRKRSSSQRTVLQWRLAVINGSGIMRLSGRRKQCWLLGHYSYSQPPPGSTDGDED